MAAGEDSVMLATAPPHVKRELEPPVHEPINLKSEVPEPEKHCLELTPVCYESEDDSCSSSVPSPSDQSMAAQHQLTENMLNNRLQQQQQQQQQQQHENTMGNNSPQHQHSTNNNLPLHPQDTKPLHLNGSLSGMVNLHNLQNLSGLQSQPAVPPMAASQLINTPLNLSINATGSMSMPGLVNSPPQLLAAPQPAAMPQFILASGQLVQGIQGAQLLIPTSQGIATQTILTIPVNHVTSNQMVNLALSNGQVITTTLANLQTMAQPHHLLAPTHNSVPCTSPSVAAPGLNNHLPHQLLSNGHQQQQHHQQQQQQLINALQQHQQQQQQQQQQHSANNHSNHSQKSPMQPHHNHNHYASSGEKSPPHGNSGSNGMMTNGTVTSSSASSSPLNTINRLAANNSDLTITTTSKPPPPPTYHHNNNNNTNTNNNMQHSPGLDLLDDSPNQPTISQSNCNMVDGINLDEIKEFAKAFKLRRLSLGLTQTQVGQALSITEGPAYSQSAICSALATQMYCAAQLASQQHYMFEKLDITPKSAQKIKPVLERWMKEAEERAQYPQPMTVDSDAPRGLPDMYKSGQNHLTEFIGVEPSKKRKRRTSFTPQALELLNAHFERNTHPSGTEITTLAHQLGYEREVIRIWFCNKRQALKNTVRMMSKSCTPPHLGGANHLTT